MLVMPLVTHSSGLWPYSITESETVCLVALATHPGVNVLGTLPTFQLLWTWMDGWFTSSREGELLWYVRPASLTQRIWLAAGHWTAKRTGNRPIAYVHKGQWISPSWRFTVEFVQHHLFFCLLQEGCKQRSLLSTSTSWTLEVLSQEDQNSLIQFTLQSFFCGDNRTGEEL